METDLIKALRCHCTNCRGKNCDECEYSQNTYSDGTVLDDMLAAADALESQQTRIAKLERQLEAAKGDLKMLAQCPTCASWGVLDGEHPCSDCNASDKWEWRGCKTEEGEKE